MDVQRWRLIGGARLDFHDRGVALPTLLAPIQRARLDVDFLLAPHRDQLALAYENSVRTYLRGRHGWNVRNMDRIAE